MVKLTTPEEMAIELKTGCVTWLTVRLKLLVALRLGVPLSDTTIDTELVVPVWLTNGRQLKIALVKASAAKVEFDGPPKRR